MAESWVRLWAGMTTDPKFRTVARKSGASVVEVVGVFTHLMLIANEGETRGTLDGMNVEDVASALDMEEERVVSILNAMEGRLIDDLRLSGWDKRQPNRNDEGDEKTGAMSAAERKRNQREREKTSQNQSSVTTSHDESRDVTTSHAPEAEAEAETEAEKSGKAQAARATIPPADSIPPPTETGEVCKRLKAIGYGDTNPHDQKLKALLAAGLTADEVIAIGNEARGRGKGFRWVLAAAEARRREAANVTQLPERAASGTLSKAGQRTVEAASRWLESEGVRA
jgi:hypothetical protein